MSVLRPSERGPLTLGNFFLAVAVITAGMTVQPTPAHAYECLAGSCPKWCETVPYGITVASPDLGDATTVTETRRGMDDWTTRSCTNLTNRYTGRSGARAGAGDGQSMIGWVESGWRHGSSAIGVTGPRWRGDNCIIEADMEMNGENFTWVTGPGRGGNVNTYSIALHEGGHYYGLGHSDDPNATMYFAYTGGIDAIGSDDQNGICFLYPGTGGGLVDCTTGGCPAGQECNAAAKCVEIVGDGTMCSPCGDSSECGGAGDFCLGYPSGAGFCGRNCNGPSDCTGEGEMCVTISGGINQCIRVVGSMPSCAGVTRPDPMPECTNSAQCAGTLICLAEMCVDPPPGLLGIGEMCDDSSMCASALCSVAVGGRCSERCDPYNVGSCSTGFYCDGDAAPSACGDGLCLSGSAGATPLGGSCASDTDCSTLMCDQNICASPCQLGGAVTCPGGALCQVGAIAGCGACKPEGSLGAVGDACEFAPDCQTNQCARSGDETFCTSFCVDESDCPDNFSCVPVDERVNVCFPGGPSTMDPGDIESGCGCRVSAVPLHRTGQFAIGVLFGLIFWRRRRPGPLNDHPINQNRSGGEAQ